VLQRIKREVKGVWKKTKEKLRKQIRLLQTDRKRLVKLICGILLCAATVTIYFVRYETAGDGYWVERTEGTFLLADTVHGSDAADGSGAGEEPENGSENEKRWILHIDGAVQSPGIYELPPESRVYQLIDAAGGLLEHADARDLNQAAFLEDGLKIYIPTKQETSAGTKAGVIFSGVTKPGSSSVVTEQGTETESKNQQGAEGTGEIQTAKVNLNTATSAQLESLPGIGPSTAAKIIDYRRKAGGFKTIESLMNVSGIGEKTFAKLKDSITVE